MFQIFINRFGLLKTCRLSKYSPQTIDHECAFLLFYECSVLLCTNTHIRFGRGSHNSLTKDNKPKSSRKEQSEFLFIS